MAKEARKPRVIFIVVLELREVSRRLRRRMSENSLFSFLQIGRRWQLVTRVAVWRQRSKLTLLIMAGEAIRVRQ